MFKTERDNNLDSRYIYGKESIQSRYMISSKKKSYLAGADHNLNQLREGQLNSLTELLIELKSEYDELIRETSVKKRETEELGKQIEMLEKMDKKTKTKLDDMDENYSNMESLIEMKKVRREEELYNRSTLVSLIEKLKEEVLYVKKDINNQEFESKQLNKRYEKERITENSIKEKVNQIYSKITNHKLKNSFDRNENNLMLQYYQNIIEQKWSFIHSADDRKIKQIKIAIDAKNDSQDKQEVEKRKLLFMYMLYDKYLKKKMERELKENEKIEETFQTIRDITGSSNLKTMVDKILNKDKNYNLCVARVTEKQNKIDIVKKDISALEIELQSLKNDFTDQDLNSTSSTTTIGSSVILEEGDANLVNEETLLMEELKNLQDKHKNVRLVYEKVLDNINKICRVDSKKDETHNLSISSHLLNTNEMDSSNIINNQPGQIGEDDLVKLYSEFLENTKSSIDTLFLKHTKEEFMKLMRSKGHDLPVIHSKSKKSQNNQSNKRQVSNIVVLDKNLAKDLVSKPIISQANEEYAYSDEELKKEDDEIRTEKDEIMKQYKAIEKAKMLEAMKSEKDKK